MNSTGLRAAFCVLAIGVFASRTLAEEPEFQSVPVKPGDTLWSISRVYLKDAARWDEILKYNPLLSSDPSVALPGMTLKVPVTLMKDTLRAARLVSNVNKVLYRKKSTADWKPTSINMELFQNDWLRTLEESQARVRFLNQDLLQLGENSMAVIKPVNQDYAVELKRGGTFVGRAKIVTASAKVTPRSSETKYMATVGEDLSTVVEVYKGGASVESGGQSVELIGGMATEAKIGLPPSLPFRIPDMAGLEARMTQMSKGPAPAISKAKIVVAAPPAARPPAPPGKKSLSEQLRALQVGKQVSGHRVQCGLTHDLADPQVNKVLYLDESITDEALGLSPGDYWCRSAALDLLGSQGPFTEPRRYTAGGGAP